MAYVTGTALANFLNGTAADDVIFGLDGNDRINGLAGDDILIGGIGADIFVHTLGQGFDAIVDGAAGDVLRVEGYSIGFNWTLNSDADLYVWFVEDADYARDNASGVRLVNHYAGSAISYIEGDFTYANADYGTDITSTRLYFTPGGTGINQGNYSEILLGTLTGDDSLVSGGGYYDEMFGFDGDDTLIASAGQQTAFLHGGDGNDFHFGSAGRDLFRGNRGYDFFDGGAGTSDVIDYRDGGDGVKVDLARTGLQYVSDYEGADVLLDIEQVRGSRWNDTLLGGNGNDVLVGRDGRDILNGRLGADTMEGGQDNDIYYVDNAGDDVRDVFNAFGGYDRVISTVNYTLSDSSVVERLSLTGAALSATGNGSSNRIDGTAGNNTLSGLNGNDQILGFAGNDQILGGEGNDRLLGGAGLDTLTGGNGNDRFEWDATIESAGLVVDRVADFIKGQDILDFATIDANVATTAYENFTFIGAAAFTAAGQIRAVAGAGGTTVQVNTGGTLAPDMTILLAGFGGVLAAGDFVL
jgi:Ca2+-binding RTX toxin-like protein